MRAGRARSYGSRLMITLDTSPVPNVSFLGHYAGKHYDTPVRQHHLFEVNNTPSPFPDASNAPVLDPPSHPDSLVRLTVLVRCPKGKPKLFIFVRHVQFRAGAGQLPW